MTDRGQVLSFYSGAVDIVATTRTRTRPEQSTHGASGRRGTGDAPGGSGGRDEGAGRSARRAPGGAPISPPVTCLASLPRRVAAAKGRLRSARASGALADNRGYRPRNG